MNSTNVVTDAAVTPVEAEDFTPYGGSRMDTKTNYGGVRNKYSGTVHDALSGPQLHGSTLSDFFAARLAGKSEPGGG